MFIQNYWRKCYIALYSQSLNSVGIKFCSMESSWVIGSWIFYQTKPWLPNWRNIQEPLTSRLKVLLSDECVDIAWCHINGWCVKMVAVDMVHGTNAFICYSFIVLGSIGNIQIYLDSTMRDITSHYINDAQNQKIFNTQKQTKRAIINLGFTETIWAPGL